MHISTDIAIPAIRGGAGIGKTALLEYLVETASELNG